ncbi:TorD/DmsD family molecular chaperone [Candidatus Magnetobacterium casense]|uniref:Molecular chaperone TorD family protein n=1 Tax=Candidatus Magnetobacterium casense TaxID=1455061 RepID=A0ABS6RVC2_9BACT|nr:molecular chaperone TorD family protein [Candidatus Magnetobacterium casensis]MBV6340577.1 molecular chaperone TorD family protein [Candidatus Magnetobacterium casensis]
MEELVYLYKLASLGLSYPQEASWSSIENILSERERLFTGDILRMVNDFNEQFELGAIDDLRADYLNYFDMGGQISPYETEYLTEKISRKPFELADIAGFYRAFGLSVNESADNKELIDHISVELEFMALLTAKALYAMDSQSKEHEEIVLDAKEKFLRDHLARWGFFYCRQLESLEGGEIYKSLGRIVDAVLTLECERHGLDKTLFNKDLTREALSGVRCDTLSCGPLPGEI